MPNTPQPLGTIYLPSNPGTPVGEFRFIVDAAHGQSVVIGTPVAADTSEGTVVGTVTDLITIGTDKDPLQADMRNTSSATGPVARTDEVLVAVVQVFHSERMRPVRAGTVRPATATEMLAACGYDNIDWPISAGVVPLADGSYAKVALDGHTLLGPESAHLTVGGLSGMAAKTSFAGVLLRSAIHAGRREGDSVGAIIFNVKGQDLVNLDEPPAAGYELSETDLAIYEAMGVPATPFEDVVVYAPALPGSNLTRSSKETAEPLRWDLRTVWPYLRYFFPSLFDNDNMMAFFGDFESILLRSEDPGKRIDTFDKFEKWIDTEIADAEEQDRATGWRSHHVATLRRARKQIMSLPGRCGGLLTTGKAKDTDDVPVRDWRPGQVVVVDIAGLETIVQAAVIARTCTRLLESAEHGELGLDHLILFADELNMFAPASGGEMSAVRNILRKISATGRYAGMSLWGAAQFISQVDTQILGNAATRAAGIVSETELDSGVYGRMPAGQKERMLTLPKGQMALKAYNLRGQLVVQFPRPAWKTGKAKGPGARKDATATLGMTRGSVQRLTEGIPTELVEQVIAKADDPALAAKTLEQLREPDMAKVSVESGSTYRIPEADSDNPWEVFGVD
jgi:hypothetical protein